MNKTYYKGTLRLLPVLCVCIMSGCKKDFLDQKGLSAVTETGVFADSTKSLGAVNNI
ncbi:MAG TPA: hypothetical protein VF008_04290 [Niastella sp.]